jgi:hypothetical protein
MDISFFTNRRTIIGLTKTRVSCIYYNDRASAGCILECGNGDK